MDPHFLLAQVSSGVSRALSTKPKAAPVSTSNEVIQSLVSSLDFVKNFVLAVAILVAFYILGKIIAGRLTKSLQKAQGDALYPDTLALVNRFSVVACMFIGISIVLQFIFQVDFLQVVGFFGLGLGFAFKDLFENLIAGAAIILQNRFRVGDFIEIKTGSGLRGKIMEIQTRATLVKAIDGSEIIVPNAQLMANLVTCYTAHHSRRISFTINVDFETDLQKAMKIILGIIDQHEYVLKKPKPQVLVSDIGGASGALDGSGIKLNVRFWVDPQDNKAKSWIVTKSELMAAIKEAFDKEGILIPYPLFTYLETKRQIALKTVPTVS